MFGYKDLTRNLENENAPPPPDFSPLSGNWSKLGILNLIPVALINSY